MSKPLNVIHQSWCAIGDEMGPCNCGAVFFPPAAVIYATPEETMLTPRQIAELRQRAEQLQRELDAARATIAQDAELAEVFQKRAEAAETISAERQAMLEDASAKHLKNLIRIAGLEKLAVETVQYGNEQGTKLLQAIYEIRRAEDARDRAEARAANLEREFQAATCALVAPSDEVGILTVLDSVFDWHKVAGEISYQEWMCQRVSELKRERDEAHKNHADAAVRAAEWQAHAAMLAKALEALIEVADCRTNLEGGECWHCGSNDDVHLSGCEYEQAVNAATDILSAAPASLMAAVEAARKEGEER